MKITVVFKPDGDPGLEGNKLVFVDVLGPDGEPITEVPECCEWIADGEHEALVIDTDKL